MSLIAVAGARLATRRPAAPSRRWLTAAAFTILLAGVLAIHGFVPGESQPMLQTILDSGAIQCLHDEGWRALTARCDAVGRPIGLTFLTGMPETMLGWALSWIPGVDAWSAHQLLNAVLDGVALGGGYLLLRRWGVARGFALVAPAAYLVSPSLIGINGFQYTFTGYTFLPLYVLLFLRGLDCFAGERRARVGTACLVVDAFLMVFTDGYSYATALLLVGILLLWWLWRDVTAGRRQKLAAAVTFAVANAAALLAYAAYINAPTSPTVGLGAYRYLGLDPITLVVPLRRLAWPSHLGYVPPSLHLYGDGSNYSHNYLGIVMIGLAVWLFAAGQLRSHAGDERRELGALSWAAVLALILSFGPALKLNSRATPLDPPWDLPTSKTLVGLPTKFLYAHVPPFDAMRATFRWSIGFRFVLVFVAAVAVGLIWKAGRRGIAAVLFAAAVLEILPPPRFEMSVGRDQAQQLKAFRSQGLAEFDALTHRGERVLMLPTGNDFLANALAPFAQVSTYNVGIDKSYAATRRSWPEAFTAAAEGVRRTGEADRIAAALSSGADSVVLCYFSLLTGAETWPAPLPDQAAIRGLTRLLSGDPRFTVDQGGWMAVVRLRR